MPLPGDEVQSAPIGHAWGPHSPLRFGHSQIPRSAGWGEPITESCSLPVPHQGLRAPRAGTAAWTRPRRAQQTRSASSCAPSTWPDAWAARRRGTGAARGAARVPAARRALRRFFARGPPALTQALLFCRCESPACAERRRQTFAPACAFAGPGPAPPSCLKALDRCERGRLCRCVRAGLGR